MNFAQISMILLSVFMSAGSQIILKSAVRSPQVVEKLAHGISIGTMLSILLNPMVILGFSIFGLSAVLWLLVLSKTPLSYAYPFVSIGIISSLVAGSLLFGERVSNFQILGAGLICVGLAIFAFGK